MAALDKLLRALVANRMDALILEPDSLPKLRRGESDREVTQTRLSGAVIERLLGELDREGPAAGDGKWQFDYPLDDVTFRFEARRAGEGWRAEARPLGADGAEAAAGAQAEAVPEPAPEPVGPAREVGSLEELLVLMVDRGASDLHLSAGEPPRLRVDGELTPLAQYEPPTSERVKELLFGIAAERNRGEFEEKSDTDFGYELDGKARFRVNVFRDRKGVGAVFRQIPTKIPTADEIGLPEPVRKLAFLAKGLVLVTGPTGSGKSTTLAALLDIVNRTRHDHIITIEDPIEFVHPSRRCLINQREVGVHTGSFKHALRAALREDPDVVMVGEMRDLETVSIAIETAETGHLVFGTLHTTTAPSTIERLVDQFPGDRQGQIRLMLADSLRAVIAQTLLKKIGGGRVAAYEVLVCTPAVSNLIREGKTFQLPSAMQTGKKQGMALQAEALMKLVEDELVEPKEAYLKAVDKEVLVNRFRAAGIKTDFLEQLGKDEEPSA